MIRVENVTKSFGRNQILKGISLSVDTGDVVVVLGASGSGKTTLLRCIEFLETADGGTLYVGAAKYDMHNASKKEIYEVRKKTAFVFQNHNLFNNKTAIENVMEGLVTGRRMPKGEAYDKASKALMDVGLSDKFDSYPSQLSGGQQQRVGIARALVLDPEVILFDEPTSALDPELVQDTLLLLKRIAGTGITMIVVTHELSFAQEVANKVVFMADGLVVEEGEPQDIFVHPKEERTKQFLEKILPSDMYYI